MIFGPVKLVSALLLLSLGVQTHADTNHFRSIYNGKHASDRSAYLLSKSASENGRLNRVRSRQSETPPVYPGCTPYTQSSLGKTLIVDDSEPRTLQELFDDGTITPGMTVSLRRQEGSLSLSSSNHEQFTSADSDWLTIQGEDNASIESIRLTSVKNIRVTSLNIGDEFSDNMVYTNDTENVIVDKNTISAGDDYLTWDAQKWQEIGAGIHFYKSKCSSAYDNDLKNLRSAVTTYTYDDAMRQEVQSQKALIQYNFAQNISGDFFRPIGSDITIDGNTGLDQYVSIDDGDDNHDDFIQGFAYPLGAEFDNVKITNNFYQSSTDYTRPYQSPGQGIVIFDGLYTNFEISNNTLISDMYHGITVFWGRNGLIKNNTSVVIDNNNDSEMWIDSDSDKSGDNPPQNVKVINNVTGRLILHSDTSKNSHNNVVIEKKMIADQLVEYDTDKLKYDVSVKASSPYYVKGTGSSITTIEESMK